MKFLRVLLLGLLPFSAYSQGPQIPVDVPIYYLSLVEINSESWLYLPQNYHTSAEKYPVVIFFPGSGVYNRSGLLSQSLPGLIANGMRPDNIINPADGKSHSFIVLSGSNVDFKDIPAQVRWLKQNYRIDTNRIYITGLSAGASIAMKSAAFHDSVSKNVTAVVAMSTPPGPGGLNTGLVRTHNIKTLQYSGNGDTYTPGAQAFEAAYNAAFPNSSKLNIFNGGHCCWDTFYDVNFDDPNSGQSIWEWMLTNTKAIAQPLPVKFKSIKLTKQK